MTENSSVRETIKKAQRITGSNRLHGGSASKLHDLLTKALEELADLERDHAAMTELRAITTAALMQPNEERVDIKNGEYNQWFRRAILGPQEARDDTD